MKIRTSYNEQDIDFCYDTIIATVIAMTVIITIAKIVGVI